MVQKHETRIVTLDLVIARGLADVKLGNVVRAEDVFARLEEKYQAQVKDSAARNRSS